MDSNDKMESVYLVQVISTTPNKMLSNFAHGHLDPRQQPPLLGSKKTKMIEQKCHYFGLPPLRMLKKVTITIVLTAVILAIGFYAAGPSRSEVAGVYHRNYLGVAETLQLNEDGSFQQSLVYPDTKSWATNGHWVSIRNAVEFDGYYKFWDMEKEILITPPSPVGPVSFEAGRNALGREFQTSLVKQKLP